MCLCCSSPSKGWPMVTEYPPQRRVSHRTPPLAPGLLNRRERSKGNARGSPIRSPSSRQESTFGGVTMRRRSKGGARWAPLLLGLHKCEATVLEGRDAYLLYSGLVRMQVPVHTSAWEFPLKGWKMGCMLCTVRWSAWRSLGNKRTDALQITKTGASLTPGLLPDNCLWLTPTEASQLERHRRSESSTNTSWGLPWTTFRRLSQSSSSSKK